MLAHNQHACRQQRWRTVCHSLLKSLQSKIISSRLLSKRFEHDIRRASRPVTGESVAKVARSALECGGSSHRFPPVVYTGNGQEPKQTSASHSGDGDVDERLGLIEGKAVAAAAALQSASRNRSPDRKS